MKRIFKDPIDQTGHDWWGKQSRTQQRVLTQAVKSLRCFLSRATEHYRSFYLPSLGSPREAKWLIVILVVTNSEFRLLGQ